MTDWRRLREAFLKRDGGKCAVCGAKATVVAHRKPLRTGGTNDLDNLVSVCERHL